MKTQNTDNMTPTEIARGARKIAVDWVRDNYPALTIKDANPRYSDIVATDACGNEYCFEVKGTTNPTSSFGATTVTECEHAVNNIERYWFLLVYIGGDNEEYSVIRKSRPFVTTRPGLLV